MIRQVDTLGDDAVEPRTQRLEPAFGGVELLGSWRQPQRRIDCRCDMAFRKILQSMATLRERTIDQRTPLLVDQQIEEDELHRMFSREPIHSALCGMDAHEQSIEGKYVLDGDYQLAVDDETRSGERA